MRSVKAWETQAAQSSRKSTSSKRSGLTVIVVDTNILLYLYVPGAQTDDCVQLLEKDPEWASPSLWRSEFCNTLLLYLRKRLITREFALQAVEAAALLIAHREYVPVSATVIDLAMQSNCTYYDCEFIALARSKSTKLVTQDRALLKAFPDEAVSLANALSRPQVSKPHFRSP